MRGAVEDELLLCVQRALPNDGLRYVSLFRFGPVQRVDFGEVAALSEPSQFGTRCGLT